MRSATGLVLLLLLVAMPGSARQSEQGATLLPDVVTNQSVVEMVEAGLADEIIIQKIRASNRSFDLSTNALIELKKHGVSQEVLHAMLESGSTVAPSGSTPAATRPRRALLSRDGSRLEPTPRPRVPVVAESGIYFVQRPGSEPKLVKLEPAVYTQARSSGTWKSAISYGILKSQSRAVIRGAHANLQIETTTPEFLFVFEIASPGLSASSSGHGNLPTSANEFVLVKLDVKKDRREIVIGEFGKYTGAQSGTPGEYVVPFDFERLDQGVYRVRPKAALERGEYCFYYGGAPTRGSQGRDFQFWHKLFDFGVPARH